MMIFMMYNHAFYQVGTKKLTVFHIFELLIFKKIIEDVITPTTNQAMEHGEWNQGVNLQ